MILTNLKTMSFTSSINRTLNDPSKFERRLLESELEDEPPEETAQFSFLNSLTGDLEAKVVKINKNTDQKVIVVTQDKTLLCLKRNLAKLGKREWLAPLTTVVTILISLITADFKSALGLGHAEWRAIFIVCGFLATGWLAYTVRKALHAKNFHEVIRDIVYDLAAHKKYVQ